ncbi:MAG: tRNA 2-thiouridine(34) synthase MnmA [Clostridia bacterium]|nr:tRNA 2-thiouridine(34) synthase MnmA [Clostridia bacterium]
MRIVVGMSGGVDSSVAAYLLKKQGYDVIGVFMNNWEEKEEDGGVCTSERDWLDVRDVCDKIDIPYFAVNFAKEYMDRVFTHFLDEYRRGRTPNPDVLCNREIKFAPLLDFAMSLEADLLATGHFAGVEKRDGLYRLLRAKDENKDQTYFLCLLNQKQLSKAMFPVTNLTKAEIRALAREAGIPVSEKKDSTGVCFIGERNFKRFLSEYLPAQPGKIVTPSGEVVGRHDGLMYYTLGQRRGLGIGGRGTCERWFVVDKDLNKNQLIVEQGESSPRLFSTSAIAENAGWIIENPPCPIGSSISVTARFRHRQPLTPVTVTPLENGNVHIEFEIPQRAVTPGQTVAFYKDDECLGGATIDRTERKL